MKIFMQKVTKKMRALAVDAFLMTDEADVRYLGGVHFEGCVMLVRKSGGFFYFVDDMNYDEAKALMKGSGIKIVGGPVLKNLSDFINRKKFRKIGFSERRIRASEYFYLTSRCKKTRFIKSDDPVAAARTIKTPEEIKLLRRAAKETVKIWNGVEKKIRPGMREKDIARMVEAMIISKGYERSFPPIVASGPNTAYPHATPGARKVKRGDHVLVDFGIRHKGYCSDLTRIWAKGRINTQLSRHIRAVDHAQKIALENIKPGVKISVLAKKVLTHFAKMGYKKSVKHGLGHGIGLAIHEAPFLNTSTQEKFEKGMVFTVEPGLYLAGKGGARKEDIVAVTAKGVEVLSEC